MVKFFGHSSRASKESLVKATNTCTPVHMNETSNKVLFLSSIYRVATYFMQPTYAHTVQLFISHRFSFIHQIAVETLPPQEQVCANFIDIFYLFFVIATSSDYSREQNIQSKQGSEHWYTVIVNIKTSFYHTTETLDSLKC